MTTNINTNQLKRFIFQNFDVRITEAQAKKAGINKNEFAEGDLDGDNAIEINEILQDQDLYAQFATLYVEEQEKKQEAKDKDKEKEKQTQVKDKNEAGV